MKTKTSSKKLSTPFPIRQSAGRCFPLAATLVAAALIACPPLQSRADPIALSFTDGTPSSQNNVTFGWRFLLQAPVHVFKLGLWDQDNDGFGSSHIVGIWNSTGTLLTQLTIPSGTGGTLVDGFRYFSIPLLTLPRGSFTVGALYPDLNTDAFVVNAKITTASPVVLYRGPRSDGPGFVFPPDDIFTSPRSYFGPNFTFLAIGPVKIPDSGSTCLLLLLGLLSLLAGERLRRQIRTIQR